MNKKLICPFMSRIVKDEYMINNYFLKKQECLREECALWNKDFKKCSFKGEL